MSYRIATARQAKGWSQQKLADMVGTTQQQVTRWETGKRDIRASDVIKLSAALGVTVSYLLGVDGNGRPDQLNDDEARLLSLYRSTDERGKAAIMAVARSQRGDKADSAVTRDA